jgi:hypothetical protein
MSPLTKLFRIRQQPLKVLKVLRKAKHLEKVRESKRVCFAGDSVSRLVHAKACLRMNRQYHCVAKHGRTIADTLKQVKTLKKPPILAIFLGPNHIDGLLPAMDDFDKLLTHLNLLSSSHKTNIYLALIPRNEGTDTVAVKGKKIVVSGSLRQKLWRREVHAGHVHLLQTTVHADDYAHGDILHPSDTKIAQFVEELVTRRIIR